MNSAITQNMDLLRLERVDVQYEQCRNVLRSIDLGVRSGEFWGLLGPNGSGKSTLIRAAAGVQPTSAGRVLFDSTDVRSIRRNQLAMRLAVVPQDIPSIFAFTVRETVAMGRYPYAGRFRLIGPNDVTAVDQAMQWTDIAGLAGRSMDALSGGERQRVILARALAQQPELLLLDEPTSQLDINHQVEVFDLLSRLNRETGLTILCVTHDLNFAASYCPRLALLDGGRIVQTGSPGDVLRQDLLSKVYRVPVQVERRDPMGPFHIYPASLRRQEYPEKA